MHGVKDMFYFCPHPLYDPDKLLLVCTLSLKKNSGLIAFVLIVEM